jgi:hypothetical protein
MWLFWTGLPERAPQFPSRSGTWSACHTRVFRLHSVCWELGPNLEHGAECIERELEQWTRRYCQAGSNALRPGYAGAEGKAEIGILASSSDFLWTGTKSRIL